MKKYKNSYDLILFCGSFNINSNFPEIKQIYNFGFKDSNKEFIHQSKVISDYIFTLSKEKIVV